MISISNLMCFFLFFFFLYFIWFCSGYGWDTFRVVTGHRRPVDTERLSPQSVDIFTVSVSFSLYIKLCSHRVAIRLGRLVIVYPTHKLAWPLTISLISDTTMHRTIQTNILLYFYCPLRNHIWKWKHLAPVGRDRKNKKKNIHSKILKHIKKKPQQQTK